MELSENNPEQNTSDRGHVLITDLSFTYDDAGLPVFEKLSINVKPNEILVLLGHSGCGKSTLLNLIAGFIFPTSGIIAIDGVPVTAPTPNCGIVFQDNSLFPWKTVKENIQFGLRMQGYEKQDIERITHRTLQEIGLNGFENYYPDGLSGGMAQRVAFARTIVNKPSLVLLDEPFGSLDPVTRAQMRTFFLDLWNKYKTTIVFVTHDLDEALLIGDRILLLSKLPTQVIEDIRIENPRPNQKDLLIRGDIVEMKKNLIAKFYQ